jgi:hypothetical protein
MRGTALCLFLALLAGCGGGGPAPLPTGRTSAYFPAGGVADTIDIDALDRLPLRSAELVAPAGRTTAARSIATQPAGDTGTYSGIAFAPSTIGGNAMSPGAVGAAVQAQTKLLAISSSATIALPDPVAYRRDWPKYRIRLHFGDPPDSESREIAAPEPPPVAGNP